MRGGSGIVEAALGKRNRGAGTFNLGASCSIHRPSGEVVDGTEFDAVGELAGGVLRRSWSRNAQQAGPGVKIPVVGEAVAENDELFEGKLREAWDREEKKNGTADHLIIVLCKRVN